MAAHPTSPLAPVERFENVLGMQVGTLSFDEFVEQVCARVESGLPGYLVAVASHTLMEGFDKPLVRQAINGAFLVIPDGMPVVKALRRMGHPGQERVTGPDLTGALFGEAERRGLSVGFLGGTPECLDLLRSRLSDRHPQLEVAYMYSPPFRKLTDDEEQAMIDSIHSSGVQLLFIGLGTPKQEIWMFEHRNNIQTIMLGVGAAFDFHAGLVRRAPRWIQNLGFEWLYRLLQEPRRLWRRYFKNNPRFLWHTFLQRSGRRSYVLERPAEVR